MAAIQSLLRVMSLRDAEAMILESAKIPSLRRRGQLEALAMPPLEAQLLADFAAPLLAGRGAADGPAVMPLVVDGASYQVTIEQLATGIRIVVRRGKPGAAPSRAEPPPSEPRPAPWWAQAPTGAPAPHGGSAPAASPVITAAGDPAARRSEARARLTELLAPAVAIARERGASDLIASTGHALRLRVDGRLETLEQSVHDDELAACVAMLGTNTDCSTEIDGVRVRCNAFDHLAGVGIAVRLIRDRVPALSELALPAELAHAVEHRDGLVLVCGPTGSGKSTTLASLIDALDQRRAAHVITLEDPIEYRLVSRRGLIHQRELGTHVPTFADGLRAALREAPDVILLGELRDAETIGAALTAAETGHLVLATLHAPNAAGAIDRVIDAFPDAQQRQVRWQLAGVLRTVITQFLLPRRDGGRAPAVEVVPVTTAVANIMRKGDLHTLPTAINTGRDAGMIPLERSLARLIDNGAVAPQVVKKIAADHDLLAALSSKLR